MKNTIRVGAILAIASLFGGCAYAPAPVTGFIYSNQTFKSDVNDSVVDLGSKKGTACTKSYLGVVATGNGGIDEAAKAGGITKVTHVDYESMSVLGLFAKFCTVAYGN